MLENITLGTESLWSWRQQSTKNRARLSKLIDEFGLTVNPDALVSELSVGERQRVEILKALYRDARILILDEPTAVLTPQESERLFDTLRSITAQGLAVIFISHKLHEILAVSNRVLVLRRGAIVATLNTEETSREQLAELMVGRVITRPQLTTIQRGSEVLEVSKVSTRGHSASALKEVNLSIHAHEIVGIAGVAGNGQNTLVDILCGLPVKCSGDIQLDGSPFDKGKPRSVVARGVGRIPEDRHSKGMVVDMQVWENLISEDVRSSEISTGGFFINSNKARARAREQIEAYDVRCEGPEASTRLLSGGNMQKLILARALSRKPRLIIANQPVRGLDEGAIAYVQERLLEARRNGAAILLISEDLDELLSLCDRIAVMSNGQLSSALAVGERSVAEIGLMMAGQQTQQPAGAHL